MLKPLNCADFYMFADWDSTISSKLKVRVFYGRTRKGKSNNSFLAALLFIMGHYSFSIWDTVFPTWRRPGGRIVPSLGLSPRNKSAILLLREPHFSPSSSSAMKHISWSDCRCLLLKKENPIKFKWRLSNFKCLLWISHDAGNE